jgi:ribosomal protein L9
MQTIRKQVSFASQQRLETSYLISDRYGSQDVSVQVEELLNRIRSTRRAIRKECNEMDAYDVVELELEGSIWEMQSQCTPEVYGNMNAKQVIAALTARSYHLQQDMLELRMETLRRKGKNHQLQKQREEWHQTGKGDHTKEELKNATTPSRATLNLARALWARATGGNRDGGLVKQERSAKCA